MRRSDEVEKYTTENHNSNMKDLNTILEMENISSADKFYTGGTLLLTEITRRLSDISISLAKIADELADMKTQNEFYG